MNSLATQTLHQISGGDHSQCDRLFELVYDDFRKITHDYIRQEGAANDLRATDVVHEAYLRLIDQTRVS